MISQGFSSFVLYSRTIMSASDKLALDGPAGNGGDVYVQGGGTLAKSISACRKPWFPDSRAPWCADRSGSADYSEFEKGGGGIAAPTF